MRKFIDIALILTVTAIAVVIFCERGVAAAAKTNLIVLEQLYYDLFDKVFSSLPNADTLCVIERPQEPHDYTWMIDNQLYQRLNKSAVRHIYVNQSVDNAMRVSYRPVSQTISYKRIVKKQLERKISIQIHLQVANSQNELLYSDLLQQTQVDSVAVAKKYLENARFPFTSGRQKKSVLAVISEPVIILSITGLVIYLFYSYRSQ
ncbi:hypothetical protein JW998_12055 [candidate division KSB1 bacterium]|nr:hypothetical protein [candidate division KSB1 bacterium]